mmetsp:Transcript_59049/g.137487  ORF Transcript_59049/g.137487 Transcript_59049/m.137487 type:complete len:247 (-) Transcript_59049:2-742(-)
MLPRPFSQTLPAPSRTARVFSFANSSPWCVLSDTTSSPRCVFSETALAVSLAYSRPFCTRSDSANSVVFFFTNSTPCCTRSDSASFWPTALEVSTTNSMLFRTVPISETRSLSLPSKPSCPRSELPCCAVPSHGSPATKPSDTSPLAAAALPDASVRGAAGASVGCLAIPPSAASAASVVESAAFAGTGVGAGCATGKGVSGVTAAGTSDAATAGGTKGVLWARTDSSSAASITARFLRCLEPGWS